MASEHTGIDVTAKVGAAAIVQYAAVKLSSGVLVVTAAATDDVFGFIQEAGVAGEYATVRVSGTTKAICGSGGITAGATCGPTAAGAVVATSTAGQVVGVSLGKYVADAATQGVLADAVAADIVEIVIDRG